MTRKSKAPAETVTKDVQDESTVEFPDGSQVEGGFSWSVVDRTAVKSKEKEGFRIRHVVEDNVKLREDEGWERCESPSNLPGHIKMRLPEFKAKAREDYYERQNKLNEDSARPQTLAKQLSGGGVTVTELKD